jgi:hypothetical protein
MLPRMIQFLKRDDPNDESYRIVHHYSDDDRVIYKMTCDGCGDTCIVEDRRPSTVLELMLQIEMRALEDAEFGKRLSGEFCVLVKREYNKKPDYKLLCSLCETDEDCSFRVGEQDPCYVRLKDDAGGDLSEVDWEH